MRFVEVKTEEQQSVLMLHRTRQLFVRQRTTLINAIRAHMAEFGIVAGIGRNGVERLLRLIDEGLMGGCLLSHGNVCKRCGLSSCWSSGRSLRLTGASLLGTAPMS